MSIDKYLSSEWNAICDLCGKKRKSDAIRKTWDGLIACIDGCWYPKHPLDVPPPIILDGKPVPDARPEASDTYITMPILNTYPWGSWPTTPISDVWGSMGRPATEFDLEQTELIWGQFP